MAIYRPPKPRWRAAVAAGVAGILVGVIAGILVSRSDPDPLEAARAVQGELDRAASSLDVVAIEYDESVDAGEVVSDTEYRGTQDALESSRSRFGDVRAALEVLAPDRADSIDDAYAAVETSIEARADPAEVSDQIESLTGLLRGD
jgi:hypothetical protein